MTEQSEAEKAAEEYVESRERLSACQACNTRSNRVGHEHYKAFLAGAAWSAPKRKQAPSGEAMPPFRAWVAVHEGTRPYEGGFSTIDAEDAKWGFLNDPNVYWSSWELAEANGWRVVCVEVREVEK